MNKATFTNHRGYVTYSGKFVARFKHKPGAAGSFITFLCRNFSEAEYFGALAKGVAPLTVAMAKGYTLPHIKRWVKDGVMSQAQVNEMNVRAANEYAVKIAA